MVYEQRRPQSAHIRRRRLLLNPACVAVTMAGLGALRYDAGGFWPRFFAATRVSERQGDQAEWGDVFLAVLARFGSPAFEEIPRKYLGPILLHAGVPKACLPDLVDLVVRRLNVEGHLDGEAFVQWARSGGRTSRLSGVDKPVQYFLADAGEFAVDWMDRLIDLIERLQEVQPNLEGVRLPPWVVEDVRAHLAAVAPRARPAEVASGRRPQLPYLNLDPYGQGVELVLPAVEGRSEGGVNWHVTLDGELEVVRTRAAWPGASQTIPGATLVVSRPVRAASVSLGTSALATEVDVVDPQDPLLVFGLDGRRLPAALPLPPEAVWILRPEVAELKARGQAKVVETGQSPYGWDGWLLERVDLTNAQAFGAGIGPLRNVRGSSRARLELPPAVTGVTSMYATAVYPSAPAVILPATAGAAVPWTVLVRRPGGKPLATLEVLVEAEARIDPFEDLAKPLLGPYEVVVRGPLGRGLTREVFLVQDLALRSDPPWREFSAEGLVPAALEISVHPALRRGVVPAVLGPRVQAAPLVLSSTELAVTVQCEPAHMLAQAIGPGVTTRLSAWPLRLATESIPDTEAIAIRFPDQVDAGLLHLVKGEVVLQTTEMVRGAGGFARVDGRRFADTIGTTGSGRWELELLRRRIPVAVIRPRRLAVGAQLDRDGWLQLTEGAQVDDLSVGVYRVLKPWLPPLEAPVHGGRCGPFPELVGGGDLLVHVRIEDPWLPADLPAWPGSDNTFHVVEPMTGFGAGWDAELSRWLEGGARPAPDLAATGALLAIYGLRDELVRAGLRSTLREECAELLSDRSVGDFTAAAQASRLPGRKLLGAFVQAGAAELPSEDDAIESAAWTRSPALACCAATRAVARTGSEARDDLFHVAGPVAEALLSEGKDPHPEAGRFGQEALLLSVMPPEMLSEVLRAANLVPAQLLDVDSRAAAALALFQVRTRPGVQKAAAVSAAHADHVLRILRQHQMEGPAAAVEARRSEEGWQSLPAASLAYALAARLTARGTPLFGELHRVWRPTWATLARHAPELVEIDLVLAECLLTGANR